MTAARRLAKPAVAAGAAATAWGWFEAGWVRLRSVDVPLARVPAEIRVVHLSDFHLGLPSRGRRAVERAVTWTVEREPDLVCVTGDLVSRPRGEQPLRALLERLGPITYVVLGNHDVEHSRDPFSRGAGLSDLTPARLLVDESAVVDVRGVCVQIVGVDPRTYRRGPRGEGRFRLAVAGMPAQSWVLAASPDELQVERGGVDAEVTITAPAALLALLIYGRANLGEAEAAGQARVDGARARAEQFHTIFPGP